MSSSFVARIIARFSPLDFTNVSGFPNVVPDIKEWEDILPNFREDKDDNPAQHLFKFHKLMDQLDIHHENVEHYNSPSLFDGDEGSDIEIQEEQSYISAPMRFYSSDPVNDDFEANSWSGSKGHELQEKLILSSCSLTVEQQIQKISEPIFKTLEPEIEKFINEQKEYFSSFQDPVEIYMDSEWSKEFSVLIVLGTEFHNCKYSSKIIFCTFQPLLFYFFLKMEARFI
jgi:hypothetical protein